MHYLDMIVDQSGGEFSLIPALQSFSPEIEWCSLFQGLPEEGMRDEAPILLRIDLTQPDQRQWMQEVILSLGRQPLLLFLCSRWSFNLLSQHLIQCVDAAYAGQAGILRFFDPRVFPVLLSHVLDEEQRQQFLRPALFWSWLDRDGNPQFNLGTGDSGPVKAPLAKIDLTDKQLEHLLCVSDAHLLMPQLNPGDYSETTCEHLFNHCYALMVEASDVQVLLDDDRASFVLKHLKAKLFPNEGAKDEKTPV
ncbi:DUF4123 domain-containing protein [Photorhabdus asymbiotica]|uniref:DUF4123 domain-containing protein n=1 Tax=Photorhabdus asymbiotica TaxID=291112 RepID=UPI003DA7470E